jgi:hypothetical protein
MKSLPWSESISPPPPPPQPWRRCRLLREGTGAEGIGDFGRIWVWGCPVGDILGGECVRVVGGGVEEAGLSWGFWSEFFYGNII